MDHAKAATAGAAVYGVGGKAESANNGNGLYSGGGRSENDLSGGAADAPQSVTTFQHGSDASTVPVFLSDDPEDYFTRMNLTDSLFKVIHDRYQSETLRRLKGR
jgi:hypothetical protein